MTRRPPPRSPPAPRRQGKLWSFVETFYANQGEENSGYVTDDFLKGVATAAGVDADQGRWTTPRPAAPQDALDTADADAQAVGADSTPTFTIKQGNGAEKVLAGRRDRPAGRRSTRR